MSDQRGVERINVSEFSGTSSFLEIKDWFVKEAPRFGYVGTEEVSLVPLDSLSEELIGPEDRVLLKIDVQGYEQRVLEGARDTLPKIAMLECEMSLVPLYEGDPGLREILRWLEPAGFALVSLEPTGFLPQSGHVLQVDGIFVRRESQLDGLIR